MKRLLPLIGVAAACGACCAVPLLLPLLASVAVSGAVVAVLGWESGLAMLAGATAVAAVVWAHRTNRKKVTSPVAGTSCGCNAAPAKGGTK